MVERKRIDCEVPRFLANIQIGAAEDVREGLKAAADVEDVGERLIFLRVLQKEIAEKAFATAGHAQNQGVGDFPVVQIEVIGSVVVGFEHRQILGAEMSVRFLAGKNRKQKRQVGVVGVQQIQLAEILCSCRARSRNRH